MSNLTKVMCSEPGCKLPAQVNVELRGLCLAHLIESCYRRLDDLSRDTRNWSYGGPAWESACRITNECAQQAAECSQRESRLSNLDRARLLDITLWAAELKQRLQRSPRSALRISVRLISEIFGNSWSEETQTVDVSGQGAQIVCKHSVEIGDALKVLRLDTAEQMEVRVVWHRRNASGIQEIGVEMIGNRNFWNL
jgi:PilZ domain